MRNPRLNRTFTNEPSIVVDDSRGWRDPGSRLPSARQLGSRRACRKRKGVSCVSLGYCCCSWQPPPLPVAVPSAKRSCTTIALALHSAAPGSRLCPQAEVGKAYSYQIKGRVGTGCVPYVKFKVIGASADGISIAAPTGTFSGTPTAQGEWDVLVAMQDIPHERVGRHGAVTKNRRRSNPNRRRAGPADRRASGRARTRPS